MIETSSQSLSLSLSLCPPLMYLMSTMFFFCEVSCSFCMLAEKDCISFVTTFFFVPTWKRMHRSLGSIFYPRDYLEEESSHLVRTLWLQVGNRVTWWLKACSVVSVLRLKIILMFWLLTVAFCLFAFINIHFVFRTVYFPYHLKFGWPQLQICSTWNDMLIRDMKRRNCLHCTVHFK